MKSFLSGHVDARAVAIVLCVVFAILVDGCSQLRPFHTEKPGDDTNSARTDCTPDDHWEAPKACRSLLVEKTPQYELYFAEFDDQGWTYRSPEFHDAARQIDYAVEAIRSAIREKNGAVSIVTVVHGWKHNADYRDSDVSIFRALLTGLNHIENVDHLGCRRRIIGVYAGWRGNSFEDATELEDITFWDRKDAAARVAEGSIRELFARIRTEQIQGNLASGKPSENPCESHPVRSMIIGHSFGGLIVYSVLSEALIRDLVDMQQEQTSTARTRAMLSASREGDLVLLINPAIEATRFDALAQAFTNGSKWRHYYAPLFVSVTSVNDDATGIAFPLGRQVSTAFELYTPSIEAKQRKANLETIGQDSDYITMDLSTLDEYNSRIAPAKPLAPVETCDGYESLSNDKSISNKERLAGHVQLERETFLHFRHSLGKPPDASHAYPRQFCGGHAMVLDLADSGVAGKDPGDPNAPIWNIRTGKPIVNDHGDVTNVLLWQFIRQLYYDSE